MRQLLTFIAALVGLAGCQSQNPFAAFGPSTVPPPGVQSPAPYYPPGASGLASSSGSERKPSLGTLTPTVPLTSQVTSPRTSVSADLTPAPSGIGSSFATDASDREPIRIVENPSPAARTAAAPTPQGSIAPSSNQPPAATPLPGNRGYVPALPTTGGKTSSSFRKDPAVSPASFQQAPGTFVETPAASNQWRVR